MIANFKSIKDILIVCIFLGVLGAAVTLLYKSGELPKIVNPVYVIGEVDDFSGNGGAGGQDANVVFFSRQKKYTCYTYAVNSIIIGDKFQIEYEIDEPEKCIVHTEKPVFTTSEVTDTCVAQIVYLDNESIRFKFFIRGIEYLRFQKYDNSKFCPEMGDKYLIEYWRRNPQRSIIYLSQKRN